MGLEKGEVGEGTCLVVIVHRSGTGEVDTDVVGPADFHRRDTLGNVDTINNGVVTTNNPDLLRPFPRLLRPINIRLISGIPTQPGAHVEKQPVRNGIFVVVALILRNGLPAESATACIRIPPSGLPIKHGLHESQPLRLILWGIRESTFCRLHGGDGPECLIVVPEGHCLIRRFVVLVRADLEKHSFGDDVVILGVPSEGPVVDPCLEDRRQLVECFVGRVVHLHPWRRLLPTSSILDR